MLLGAGMECSSFGGKKIPCPKSTQRLVRTKTAYARIEKGGKEEDFSLNQPGKGLKDWANKIRHVPAGDVGRFFCTVQTLTVAFCGARHGSIFAPEIETL